MIFVETKACIRKLPLGDCLKGDLYVVELWFGSIAELSTAGLDHAWTVYWGPDSTWTVS